MDHQRLPESIARQLAQVWAIHRTPAFVEYLRQTFGCEPQKPVRFAGIFCLQMIGGYFFPDLPAGPGPVIEGLWLTDETGFGVSSMDAFRLADHPTLLDGSLESDNPLVVYNQVHARTELISSQPYLSKTFGGGGFAMPNERCAHCGDKVPLVRDAFCGTCGEALDEPPATARTPEEQHAFRTKVEQEAKEGISLLGRLVRLFNWM